MSRKRGIALVMALAMVALTACSSSTADPATDAAESPAGESASAASAEGTEGEEAPAAGGTMVYWDKSEYVKDYNTMMQEKVNQFSQQTGIEVEYAIIPSNDQKQKLMAAIEAGNPPDLFVSDDMLCAQFVAMDQIADVTDVVGKMDLTPAAQEIAKLNNQNMLVPLSMLAPGCYWRKDLWEAKGLDMPLTWQDMLEDARIVNDPANGIYALGFPMGASGGGDAESMMRSLILSFGGVPVDENGIVTINSPETLEALKFIATVYQEGLAPPDAITWDDSGNNNGYLAGTCGIIFNAGSVWSALKEEHPDLLEKTEVISYPSGPSGRSFVPGGSNTFAIFKTGKNEQAAKDFVSYYFEDVEYYNTMIEAMGGMWQPVVNGIDDTDFWKDPLNAGWMANSQNIVRNFHPAPADEYANLTFSNQCCVKAVQKIVVDNMDPQKALDELEAEMQEIYKDRA